MVEPVAGRHPSGMRFRLGISLLAGCLVLAASAATARADDPRLLWPDGRYHLQFSARGSGAAQGSAGSGVGAITGRGAVDLELSEGAVSGKVPFRLAYEAHVEGISAGGQAGTGTGVWTFDGLVVATGGQVWLDPDVLRFQLRDAVIGGVETGPLDLGSFPMDADTRFRLHPSTPVCGIVEGSFEGTVEWLALAAQGVPGVNLDPDSGIESRFVALTPGLTDDPVEWVEELRKIQAKLAALREKLLDIPAGDSAALDRLLAAARELVTAAETLGSTAGTPECPGIEGFGLGIADDVAGLLAVVLRLDELNAHELWQLAELASRSGMPMDSEIVASLLDRIAVAAAADPGNASAMHALITAAAALGAWDVVAILSELQISEGSVP